MRYNLVYTRRAVKDINSLEDNVKKLIGKALARYSQDPFRHAQKLTDDRLGSYRFRIGDYRVIFDIEGDEIVVLRVGHRKDIYKRT
ncbi:MAG TPA: type II toxin-antitoxin system RelE/ParE family toxin [Deltaproteobacteria bacterium]|nr:type II toxin-antitoxin system RelE/ParE family toxin [Deltaproteobacteria bacterium]